MWIGKQAFVLSWFPASNGFCKGVSKRVSLLSLHRIASELNAIISFNVKENRYAEKRSPFGGKAKGFSIRKSIGARPEKSLSGDCWCRTK